LVGDIDQRTSDTSSRVEALDIYTILGPHSLAFFEIPMEDGIVSGNNTVIYFIRNLSEACLLWSVIAAACGWL
jgi:hypothetical protein